MSPARRRLSAGLVLIAITIVIGSAVTWLGEPSIDEVAVREASSLRDGAIGDALVVASKVGYLRVLGPLALVIALALGIALNRWRDGLLVAFATAGAAVLTRLLKEIFERARPTDGVELLAGGFSMPSGHATTSAAFAMSLMLVARTGRGALALRVLVIAFALVVALSRVVLGVHYPTDVLAGLCSGTGFALVLASLLHAERDAVAAPR